VGGAEKRFTEMVKYFCKHNVQITVLEPQPSILAKFSTCPKTYNLSSPNFVEKNWLTLYFSWILWMIKACVYSLKLVRKGGYDIILAPNNTLPNLVSTYFVHLTSHLPICVVVHHLDALSVTQKQNFFTIYRVYRKVGYEKITSLIKTFGFVFTLLILRRVNACLTVSKTTAKILVQNGVKKDKIYSSGNGVHCPKVAKTNNPARLYDGIFVGRIAKEKGIYDLV